MPYQLDRTLNGVLVTCRLMPEKRFRIAQEVANTKDTHDVRPLFQEGKRLAGKQPVTLITDGAPNFHEAFVKEFYTRHPLGTRHIKDIRFDGRVHNNKMERMNGEIRDREKVTRNLKKMDTPILKCEQIYHNFIRPHMALDGRTPSEVAGIEVQRENKWITLIQNVANHTARSNIKKSIRT